MNNNMNSVLRFRLLTLCCAGAVWATAGLSAQAAPPAGGHGSHSGLHHNNFNHGFNGANSFGGFGGELFGVELGGNEDRIPYYALHPPVYYSYPIARPYGDSPFASPPGYYGPGCADCGPQTIINPYATPGNATPSTTTPPETVPTPPAPTSPTPKSVKPTAGRTASLAEEADSSIESLPSPVAVALPDVGSEAASNVHVVLNPYAR